MTYDYLFKFIIIGDPCVGKSFLMNKFTNMKNPDEYTMTIGVEFGVHTIKMKDKIIKFNIWDTAGQENFRAITKSYYKGSTCAIVMYDISNRESFNNVKYWLKELKQACNIMPEIAIFANKNDLAPQRKVSYEEGEELAKEYNLFFLEGSAKWNTNVEKAFTLLASSILKKLFDNEIENLEEYGIKKGFGAKNINYIDLYDYDQKNRCCSIM